MNTPLPYPPITPEELGRFHDAKGVKGSPCWICGNFEWQLVSTEVRPAMVLAPMPEMHADPLAVVPLICKNCGTVWSIAYGTLRTWQKANPA